MGADHSVLTPLPHFYFTLTFLPPDQLWICQSPRKLTSFLRNLLPKLWPDSACAEHHCESKNLLSTRAFCEQKKSELPFPDPLSNTCFRIPSNLFFTSSSGQTLKAGQKAVEFITILTSYIHSIGYDMVSSGHFMKGIEAFTCIYRKSESARTTTNDRTAVNSIRYVRKVRGKKQCSLSKDKTEATTQLDEQDNDIPKSAYNPLAEFNRKQYFTAVSLDTWNRIFFFNIEETLFHEIKEKLRVTWPKGFENVQCLNSSVDKQNGENCLNIYVIEFTGHPWDSFKENSDISPYIILEIISLILEANHKFMFCLNFRGNVDTLFFKKSFEMPFQTPQSKVIIDRRKSVYVALSLCHQTCIRVYGGNKAFIEWFGQFLHQICSFGVKGQNEVIIDFNAIQCERNEEVSTEGDKEEEEKSLRYNEIRLCGSPWCIPDWNKDDLLSAKFLVTRIISFLSIIGWRFVASISIYTGPYDKSMLVFEKYGVPDSESSRPEKIHNLPFPIENFKTPVKLLMPICITPYNTERLCIYGGSRTLIQKLHAKLYSVFKFAKKTIDDEIESSLKLETDIDFKFKDWVKCKTKYIPVVTRASFKKCESLHYFVFNNQNEYRSINCLTSIGEGEDESYLEYATCYQPWNGKETWPSNMYKNVAKKCFGSLYKSQLPLSLLCWMHEIMMTMQCSNAIDEDCEKSDVIDTVRKVSLISEVNQDAVVCMDCSSMTKNSPPCWMYGICENIYDIKTFIGEQNNEV